MVQMKRQELRDCRFASGSAGVMNGPDLAAVDLRSETLAELIVLLRQLNRRWSHHQKALESSTSAELALLALSELPGQGASQRELASRIGRSPAAMTRIVDMLEAAGMVERRPHKFDRRLNLVAITEAGRAAAHEYQELMRTIAQTAFRNESPDALAAFSATLRRVSERLKR